MRPARIHSPSHMSSSFNHSRRVPARLSCPRFAWRVLLPVFMLVFATAAAHGAENPTNLVATLEDGELSLGWSAPTTNASTVTGYQVQRRRPNSDPDGEFSAIGTTGARETTYVDDGFEAGETYVYRVKARRGDHLSDASNTAIIDVPPAPLAPSNLSSASGHQYATLSWTDPNDATITGYQYRYRTGDEWDPGWTDVASSDATTTSHRLTGLTSGRSYTIQVRAKNAGGSGAASGVSARSVGYPPANLSVAVVDGSVTASWDAPEVDAEFVTGYEVLRRQPRIDGRGVFHAIATTGAGERKYVDGSVEGGEKYAYRVKAWRGADLGLWSAWANIVAPQVPAAPGNLGAAAGDGWVTLSWDDADDATITDYQYRYRTGMTWNPDWTDIDPSDENTTSHTLRGLTNGTEHAFEVRAINANGNGTTASVTATPVSPPSAPANLTATAGIGSVTLAWDNPNDGTITVYQVRYAPEGEEGTPDWTQIEWSDVAGSDFSTTRNEVTGLTNGTAYVFQVRAQNASGDGPPASATATPFPAAPANLQAAAGVNEVALEWDDPRDAAVTVYQLKYGHGTTVVQDWSDIAGTGASTTRHTVAGLTNGTAFTFRLRAKATDAVGDSSEVTATPVPAAPANLTASAGVGAVTLTWDNPSDAAITVYQLVHYSGARPSQPSWRDISGSGATTTTHKVTSLTNGIEYTFELRAKAGSVYGDSSTVSATPKSPPPPPCPSISVRGLPSEVTATVGTTITTIQARASGGRSPYTYGTSRLPEGISIDASSGDIAGTVGAADYRRLTVTVTARDGNGCSGRGSFTFNVPCNVSLSGLPDEQKRVQVGEFFTIQAVASGGRSPYQYSLTGVPVFHVTINKTGLIAGKIPIEGKGRTFNATVSVKDRDLCTAAHSFNLIVYCPDISISGLRDVTATVGDTISMSASGSGGRLPYSYSMRWAPSWLEIDEESGSIVGVPKNTYSGRAPLVTARDSVGCTGSQLFRLSVSSHGDFNGDGRRDARDSEMFNRKFGLRTASAEFDKRMDLNKDGVINMADLVILTKYIEDDASSSGGGGDTSGSGG